MYMYTSGVCDNVHNMKIIEIYYISLILLINEKKEL